MRRRPLIFNCERYCKTNMNGGEVSLSVVTSGDECDLGLYNHLCKTYIKPNCVKPIILN